MRKPGWGRSATKQVIPPGAWARVKNMSKIGWVPNHLCPVSSYHPSPAGSAIVVFASSASSATLILVRCMGCLLV